MKLKLLFLLGASIFINAQSLTPELLYYNFENVTGVSVPNLATSPPSGTANATIVGNLTVGNNVVCPGKSLVGSSSSSSDNYLDTAWNMNISGSWSLHLKLGNFVNGSDTTLYYFFGDDSSEFRAFTNGIAYANNVILRGSNIPDITINNVFDTTQASQKDLIFTYDSATGVFKGYLNGVLATTVNGNTNITMNGGRLKVGGYSSNTGLKTGQTLDEFGFYSRALTASEVLTLSSDCSLLSVNEGEVTKEVVKFVVMENILKCNKGKIGAYQIFDMSGKLILSNLSKSNQIDISSLVKGVYVIKTNDVTQRFVK